MLPKRTRLKTFDYLGPCRYFVTICTYQRHEAFTDEETVTEVLAQIVRSANQHDFAIHAYVFMPDHVHLLVEGTSDASDFRSFVDRAKQYSGYQHSRRGNGRLWQPSYFEHVLRDDERTPRVIGYIMNNPIHAGYATEFGEYRFVGSETTSLEAIADLLAEALPAWEP